MLAVHLENGVVTVREVAKPRRERGFASIRMLYAGICNTDLELQRGYYGFSGTPGHEFVGEVMEADTASLIGKQVVGEINLACGHCEWCARGLGRHCARRKVLGIAKHPGAFREVLTLPECNLHVIPKSIPLEQAVFVEPLAAACEILDQVKIPRGEQVAVLGDGKLGLLIAQVLHAHGALVHHFGRHKEKLRISGAEGIECPRRAGSYDFVVDATGSADGLREAVGMTKPRGTLIMKSTVHGLVPVDTAPIIVNELTVVGSRCGRFEPALRLLKAGKVNVAPLISGIVPLREAAAGFDRAGQSGVLKILLQG
jgi:threonine dehydrogenase-like Zn-dependent dehydrogenase